MMDTAWAGQLEQEVAHLEQEMAQMEMEIEPHGILHTVIENVPGGEWTVLSMFLVGVGTTAWLRFGKRVEGFIGRIVEKQITKRKQSG